METPKIYVGTYAKYNNGSIAGGWLDLDDYTDRDEFYQACRELHPDENDPEFMFQDHENIPDCFIGESWISEKFWSYMEAVKEVSNSEAFEAYVNHFGYDLQNEDITELIEKFDDAFQGEQSASDFTYDLVQSMLPSDAPEFLLSYFDYDKYERDLFMGDYTEVDGFIFSNH